MTVNESADSARVDRPKILVIAVTYETPALANALAASVPVELDNVELIIADNSPDLNPPPDSSATRYLHFPDNPGFTGGARRALTMLVEDQGARLPFDAVVLCNVDLSVSWEHVVDAVQSARSHTGDTRWLLAPDIVEDGRSYRVNPQTMQRPPSFNSRWRDQLRQRSLVADIAFRQLYSLRRRHRTNPHASAPGFTRMYAAAGAFTVFGTGYFVAGGVFHEGPLFGEEFGFAEQAHALDVPVLWMPDLVVRHEAESSVSVRRNGYRRRHEWYRTADEFYRSWDVETVLGFMTDWFAPLDLSLDVGDAREDTKVTRD